MIQEPLVSVVIPSFNAAIYLDEAIRSVLSQTHDDLELIVINDGSTDWTDELVRSYDVDPRFAYMRTENRGVSSARNLGVSRARGKYIAFLDADDCWEHHNLEVKLALLESDSGLGWVYSDVFLADERLVKTGVRIAAEDNLVERILRWQGDVIPAPPSNIVVRRSCFDGELLWDPEISSAADQDLTIQLAHRFRSRRISEPLLTYRVRKDSMSRSAFVTERDHIYVYHKANRAKLFPTAAFRRQCFSNLYMIIAGGWWQERRRLRALFFVFRAVVINPPSISLVMKKIWSQIS